MGKILILPEWDFLYPSMDEDQGIESMSSLKPFRSLQIDGRLHISFTIVDCLGISSCSSVMVAPDADRVLYRTLVAWTLDKVDLKVVWNLKAAIIIWKGIGQISKDGAPFQGTKNNAARL